MDKIRVCHLVSRRVLLLYGFIYVCNYKQLEQAAGQKKRA